MTTDSQRIEGWLEDIVAWGERIGRHIAGKELPYFIQHEMTQDAVMKCIETIGEAAGNILRLQPSFQQHHPRLALSAAYHARNRIVHGYGTIELGVVWQTASVHVPEIVAAARGVLESLRTTQ